MIPAQPPARSFVRALVLAILSGVLAFPAFLHAQRSAGLPDAPPADPTSASLDFPVLLADASQAQHPAPPANPAPPPIRRAVLEPTMVGSAAPRRVRMDPSMVGYLDDPTIVSEIRIRFDAGFNDPRPDRAGYFYCGCANIGPGAAVQRTLNFQQLYLTAEYAPAQRVSGFVELPFRWIQPRFYPFSQPISSSSVDQAGISDVQAGLKFAALSSAASHLALQLTASFPSGSGAKGLGTGHTSLIPAAIFYQRLSHRAGIEAEVNDTHPLSGYTNPTPPNQGKSFAGDVTMFGIGPSYVLVDRPSYRLAPVLELVAWHVFGGLQTDSAGVVDSAAGIDVFNAKLGARILFNNGGSLYAGYGRAITSDIWYRNLFRMEYRYTF